jgi:hypothetical protein
MLVEVASLSLIREGRRLGMKVVPAKGETMPKSNPGREGDKNRRVRAGRAKGLLCISLVLSLVVAAVMEVTWGDSRATTQASKEKKVGEMATQSFSAGLPSKEYVYTGGRLIATEECGYSISPTSSFFTSVGDEGSVNVTSDCEWEVVNVPAWITLTSDPVGHGNDVVKFVVRDNLTGSARQAVFTIAGLDFTVVQDGDFPNCVYQIAPLFANFPASGGTGNINVTVDSSCGWQAVSNASWVTVTSGNVGIGNGTVSYSVAVNTTGAGRNTTITIGGMTFNVKQTSY